MKRRYVDFLTIIGLAAFLFGSPAFTPAALAQATAPPLGPSLPQFGLLGGAGVTGSTGLGTVVNGDVGSSPTPTITNFPPSRTVAPFIVHLANDAVVQQAHNDAIAAYGNLQAQGTGTPLGPQLAGATLTPGLYSFTSAADLASNGVLTLNDPTGTGIFVFNVGSSLTTNVGSSVVGTANPCNVFWRVGTDATLNGNTFFGTVIADQSVTISSADNITGRAVGVNAAVTIAGAGGNTIGGCSSPAGVVCPVITVQPPPPLPNGTVGSAYSQTFTATGGAPPFTFAVSSGALPPGLLLSSGGTLSGTPTAQGTFNFTITASDANACPGSRAYSIVIGAVVIPPGGGAAAGGPTLDSFGLMILFVLLAVAGMFAVNRFSS
jgi:hypothetical protein